MTGMTKLELEQLCSEENANRGNAKWAYWPSEVYSFGRHIRQYAFYPSFLPLYCYSDHGVGYSNVVHNHELANDAPVHFCHSDARVEAFKKQSDKPCHVMPSPFVMYRRTRKVERSPDARGTLAFPAHSTQEVHVEMDLEAYIAELKNLPEQMQPVGVCLHMHDIHKGLHKIFIKHNIPTFTAGHAHDVRFAERLYNILKNFKYTTSNLIGSYTFYSIEMGIPFSLYGTRVKYINESDPNLPKGDYNFQEKERYKQVAALFTGVYEEITSEQREFVEQSLGLRGGVSRLEMARLLYTAYFSRGHMLKDIFYYSWKNPWRRFVKSSSLKWSKTKR